MGYFKGKQFKKDIILTNYPKEFSFLKRVQGDRWEMNFGLA
ncbi:hypothetical protein AAIE21_24890 [Paenibacillus sp. 102]